MNELLKAWLRPEYLPMLAIVALTVKYAVVPAVKFLLDLVTHPKGYTSITLAYGGSIVVSFLYKYMASVGTWDGKDIIMTLIVGLAAAAGAIGTNVTTQALRGSDVSITPK